MKFLVILFLIFCGVSCRNIGGKMKRNKYSNHIVSKSYKFDTKCINNFKNSQIYSQPPVSEVFLSSMELAISSCQEAFKWDRWNCPSRQFFSKRTSKHIDREQAFVKALTTASLIYGVWKNCSLGNDPNCGCNLNLVDIGFSSREFSEFSRSGCSENIIFGEDLSNSILNIKNLSSMDLQTYANWHNSRAGIIVSNPFFKRK